MASSPHEYVTDSPPPPYGEVEEKLNDLIGSNPTPKKVLDAAKGLSKGEIAVLIKSADKHFPLKTKKEKQDFAIGFAQTASSPESKEYIYASSSSASRAAKEINSIFQRLLFKIIQIDKVHKSDFQKPLLELQNTYQTLLRDSRNIAVDIAHYGSSFDKVTVKFCADENQSIEERQSQIKDYIEESEKFKKDAAGLDSRFQDLIQSFSDFVGTFSGWAQDKEGKITADIEELENKLEDLRKKLRDLKIARDAFVTIGAGIVPVISILVQVFEAGAVPIVIGGLIAAGVSIAIIVGLTVGINLTEHEIDEKTKRKEKLEKQLEKIRQTRKELELLGNNSLNSFRLSAGILAGYWQSTIKDAQEIQHWLNEGAKSTDQPQYMKLHLTKSVASYEVMAEYMREYAQGVESQ